MIDGWIVDGWMDGGQMDRQTDKAIHKLTVKWAFRAGCGAVALIPAPSRGRRGSSSRSVQEAK